MSNLDEMEQKIDPGGGCWDHLDASRREIVHQICGEKGLALFSFLLASSTKEPGQETMAVFSLQRLRDVALQLGWSPDTVKRYVAVFRAVNLVHHYHDCRREVRLHIPLGPYVPLTTFSILDELIGKRKKQRQLAIKVKLRYITRFGDPSQTQTDEMQHTLQEVKAILDDERLEPLKRERLQMKIADVLTRLAGKEGARRVGDLNHLLGDSQATSERRQPDASSTEGDSNEDMEVSIRALRGAQEKEPDDQGDPNGQQGDLITLQSISSQRMDEQTGDLNQQQGDSMIIASSTPAQDIQQEGDSNQAKGDSIPFTPAQSSRYTQAYHERSGDLNQQQGDSMIQQNGQVPHKEGQLGDSNQQIEIKEGDSNHQAKVEVEANAGYTYNVNYLISNITIGNNVIRKKLAQFLASVLEQNEYENGYPTFSKYLKAFKVYTPDVIGRAFLATMFLLHRKNWQTSPGATFTNQCKVLSGQKPLAHYTLDDVEEWFHSWGHLSYPELIVAIAVPPPEQHVSQPAALITWPRKAPSATQRLPGYTGGSSPNKKRTYGLGYTGRPIKVNRGSNPLSSPVPPSQKSE